MTRGRGRGFEIERMVPSGSLWTNLVDTALNILYMSDVLLDIGMPPSFPRPKCRGDDNLTLLYKDPGIGLIKHIQTALNEYYRAGIDEEDFVVTYPPFHVKDDSPLSTTRHVAADGVVSHADTRSE